MYSIYVIVYSINCVW